MFEMYAETDELRNFCFYSCPKQNEVYLILFFSAVVVQNTTNSPSIYGKYSGRIRSLNSWSQYNLWKNNEQISDYNNKSYNRQYINKKLQ